MPYGILAADQIATSVTGVSLGAGNATRFKNRIINGDMRIDQRNAGASVTPATSTVVYTVDRWYAYQNVASKFSIQQNAGAVTPPVGFTNYLGATSLSAYTVSGTNEFDIAQPIEGLNVADLGWGTANAKTVTISFWVRSSLTGTFGGAINNYNSTRSYPFTYTINSANTWEYETITIAGDTSGTWLATNGIGININFSLGAGATRSGTAGAWAATNYTSATGATSVVGTNGATFYITGVQLEVGSSATGFEYVDYTTQLAMCQRYYIRYSSTGQTGGLGVAGQVSNAEAGWFAFPISMRATPSSSFSNVAVNDTGVNLTITSATIGTGRLNCIEVKFFGASSSLTISRACLIYCTSSSYGYFDFSAEL